MSINCGILDESRFWLFPRIMPGVSNVQFKQEFDRHPVVIGHISMCAQPLCETPLAPSTRVWLLLCSGLPADLSVSRGLLWFGVFNDNWHNLCLNDIVWAEYLLPHATDFGGSTLTEKAIFMLLIQKYSILRHFLLWSLTSAGQQSSQSGMSWPPSTLPRKLVFQGSLS